MSGLVNQSYQGNLMWREGPGSFERHSLEMRLDPGGVGSYPGGHGGGWRGVERVWWGMSLALATSNDMFVDDHVRFISVSLSDNPVCFNYVSLSIWAYCLNFQIQAISQNHRTPVWLALWLGSGVDVWPSWLFGLTGLHLVVVGYDGYVLRFCLCAGRRRSHFEISVVKCVLVLVGLNNLASMKPEY